VALQLPLNSKGLKQAVEDATHSKYRELKTRYGRSKFSFIRFDNSTIHIKQTFMAIAAPCTIILLRTRAWIVSSGQDQVTYGHVVNKKQNAPRF